MCFFEHAYEISLKVWLSAALRQYPEPASKASAETLCAISQGPDCPRDNFCRPIEGESTQLKANNKGAKTQRQPSKQGQTVVELAGNTGKTGWRRAAFRLPLAHSCWDWEDGRWVRTAGAEAVAGTCGLGEEVSVTVRDKTLVIGPAPTGARSGWTEAIKNIPQEALDRDYEEFKPSARCRKSGTHTAGSGPRGRR